jgi:hypothetical protein
MLRADATRLVSDLAKILLRYLGFVVLLVLLIAAVSAPTNGEWWEWLAIGWAVCSIPSTFIYLELGLKGEKLSRADYLRAAVRVYPTAFVFAPIMLVIGLISLVAWPFARPRERFERRLGQQLRRLGVDPVWSENRYRREEEAVRHDQAPLPRDRVIEVLEGLPDNSGASAARKAIADADP